MILSPDAQKRVWLLLFLVCFAWSTLGDAEVQLGIEKISPRATRQPMATQHGTDMDKRTLQQQLQVAEAKVQMLTGRLEECRLQLQNTHSFGVSGGGKLGGAAEEVLDGVFPWLFTSILSPLLLGFVCYALTQFRLHIPRSKNEFADSVDCRSVVSDSGKSCQPQDHISQEGICQNLAACDIETESSEGSACPQEEQAAVEFDTSSGLVPRCTSAAAESRPVHQVPLDLSTVDGNCSMTAAVLEISKPVDDQHVSIALPPGLLPPPGLLLPPPPGLAPQPGSLAWQMQLIQQFQEEDQEHGDLDPLSFVGSEVKSKTAEQASAEISVQDSETTECSEEEECAETREQQAVQEEAAEERVQREGEAEVKIQSESADQPLQEQQQVEEQGDEISETVDHCFRQTRAKRAKQAKKIAKVVKLQAVAAQSDSEVIETEVSASRGTAESPPVPLSLRQNATPRNAERIATLPHRKSGKQLRKPVAQFPRRQSCAQARQAVSFTCSLGRLPCSGSAMFGFVTMLCIVLSAKMGNQTFLASFPSWFRSGTVVPSVPNKCSVKPPRHLSILHGMEEPEETLDDKPTVVLSAPCLLTSYETVVRRYKPTGSWYFRQTTNGVSLTLKHQNEAPISMFTGIHDNSTIVDFLQENVFPLFGRMTAITYDWYMFQGQGLVWALLDSDESVAEMQPTMTEVAKRFKNKYLVAYVEAQTNMEWLESEFGVTTFPAVVVQQEAGGRFFLYHGAMVSTGISQFIHDVADGCLNYQPWRSFDWHRTKGHEKRPMCRVPSV